MSTNKKFEIQSYPYLESGKFGTIAAVKLDSDASRLIEFDTDWKYYKVNSVAYPIYDNLNKIFIRENENYSVIGGRVSLSLYTINNSILADSIVAFSQSGTFLSIAQKYKLHVTLFNSLDIDIGRYGQFINLESLSLASSDNICLLNGVKNYQIFDKVSGLVINCYPQSLIFNYATREFDVVDSGLNLMGDANSSYLYQNKSNGELNSTAKYTNPADATEVTILPIENFKATNLSYIAFSIYD